MTIYFGSWAIPAFVTLASIAAAIWKTPVAKPSSYFPDPTPGIVGGFLMLMAAIVSLVAWLIWALLR